MEQLKAVRTVNNYYLVEIPMLVKQSQVSFRFLKEKIYEILHYTMLQVWYMPKTILIIWVSVFPKLFEV